jgi:molecular chaperone GrpE
VAALLFPEGRFILPPMPGDPTSNEPRDEADDRPTPIDTAHAPARASEAPKEGAGEGLADLQAEAARLKDALLRTAADYDNFRKRTRRELDEARRNGREDLLRTLLPVFDNLERAIQSGQRTSDVKAMTDGLTMVGRQFTDALGREGIVRVPTVGKAFDPSVHEAIQQVETTEHQAGTVIAEVQPGYTQGDRLLRAAMVVVARGKSGGGANGESSDGPAN